MRSNACLSVLSIFVFFIGLTGCQGCASTSSAKVEEALPAEETPPVEEEVKAEKVYSLRQVDGGKVQFDESWGYVMQNRISQYNKKMPVTDVCLFAAEVNSYGELTSVPARSKIDTGGARCHLVVVCDSRSLTHFSISPDYSVRKQLIADIVKASSNFDGVQLDLEYIPARDRKAWLTFIKDLREKLPKSKMMSVCVPARFRLLSEDLYPYAEIASMVDRIFVMAYDEHWSTSKAGPIASVDWCKKVCDYAVRAVPSEKLVMGIPFYGRSWADTSTAGAWTFSGVSRILDENGVAEIFYENDIPKFTYTAEVKVTGYFNDVYANVTLCRMYQEMGVKNIGFWRIGQEDPQFWDYLTTQR